MSRRVNGAMHERDPQTGKYRPVPNTLERRLHGQCPYCLHFGTDCHCHRRKTMPISKVHDRVYLVIEDEPETRTEFPSIVIGVYRSKASAEARVTYERTRHGLQDEEAYQNSDLSWEIAEEPVWP